MAKYFAGNTLAAFMRSSASVVEVSTAGRFDSAFVTNAIKLNGLTDFIETSEFLDASSTTTLWLHCEFYSNGPSTSTPVRIFNSSGVEVFRLSYTSSSGGGLQAAYWNGSTFVNIGGVNSITAAALLRVDLKVTAGASGVFELYLAGTMLDSGAGMNAAVTNFAKVRLSSLSTGETDYSQVLAADFDTRDSRYFCQLAAALSATLLDGSGAASAINEAVLDESTSVSLPTSGNKRGFTHPTLTLPAGYMIGSAHINGRGRINGSGPTDGKFGFRKVTAGVNYSSAGLSFNTGFEARGYYLAQDPGTASDWTAAGYNDAEFFVEAA